MLNCQVVCQYPDWILFWFYSVPPDKCYNGPLSPLWLHHAQSISHTNCSVQMLRNTSAFWDVTPCSPVDNYLHFWGTYSLSVQGIKVFYFEDDGNRFPRNVNHQNTRHNILRSSKYWRNATHMKTKSAKLYNEEKYKYRLFAGPRVWTPLQSSGGALRRSCEGQNSVTSAGK
jgi:hypothetical protein